MQHGFHKSKCSVVDASIALQLPLFSSAFTSWLTGVFDFQFFLKTKHFFILQSSALHLIHLAVIELKDIIADQLKIKNTR